MDRRERLLEGLSKSSKIVEIGPSYSPLAAKSDGWNVFTIDHADQSGLVEKYAQDKTVDISRIEPVDYVWQSGTLADAVPKPEHGTFDAFIASHVIEHTTDVVGFLLSAQSLVRPGGAIILAVPDKRKCFDWFRPLSSTGDALVAHREQRSRHTAKTHFDYAAFMIMKGQQAGWTIDFTAPPVPVYTFRQTIDFPERASSPDYVDAHQWVFVPASFELIILELVELGLLDLRIEKVEEHIGTEFFAWLRRGAEQLAPEELARRRLELMTRSVIELAEQTRQIPGSPLLEAEERATRAEQAAAVAEAALAGQSGRVKQARQAAQAATDAYANLKETLRARGLRVVIRERLSQLLRR